VERWTPIRWSPTIGWIGDLQTAALVTTDGEIDWFSRPLQKLLGDLTLRPVSTGGSRCLRHYRFPFEWPDPSHSARKEVHPSFFSPEPEEGMRQGHRICGGPALSEFTVVDQDTGSG